MSLSTFKVLTTLWIALRFLRQSAAVTIDCTGKELINGVAVGTFSCNSTVQCPVNDPVCNVQCWQIDSCKDREISAGFDTTDVALNISVLGESGFLAGTVRAESAFSLWMSCHGDTSCGGSTIHPPKQGNFELSCFDFNSCVQMEIDDRNRTGGNVSILCDGPDSCQFGFEYLALEPMDEGQGDTLTFECKGSGACGKLKLDCHFRLCDWSAIGDNVIWAGRHLAGVLEGYDDNVELDARYAYRMTGTLEGLRAISSDAFFLAKAYVHIQCPLDSPCNHTCAILIEGTQKAIDGSRVRISYPAEKPVVFYCGGDIDTNMQFEARIRTGGSWAPSPWPTQTVGMGDTGWYNSKADPSR